MITPEQSRTAALLARVREFEAGACGSSLRRLALGALAPLALHEKLLAAGFRARRLAIPAARARDGAPRWKTSTTPARKPTDADVACELVYVHPDGGVVRAYTRATPISAYDEVVEGPFTRKSVLMPRAMALGLADEACVVTAEGSALPRSLRHADGLKFAAGEEEASLELATTTLAAHVVPLAPGPAPDLALSEGYGLSTGATIAPERPFGDVLGILQELVAADPAALVRTRRGARSILFSGSPAVATARFGRLECPGFASITVDAGAEVLAVEPYGYEASVNHLAGFLSKLLPEVGGTVRENASGRDFTHLATRLPHDALSPNGPSGHRH